MSHPAKKTVSIEESEVADALSMLKQGPPLANSATVSAPARVDPPSLCSPVILQDGSSLDIMAMVNASVQSFMAQQSAMEQHKVQGATPGTSGYKRPLDDSTHIVEDSKRLRPTMASTGVDPSQGDSQDEYESDDGSGSEEDEESFRFSSVFGVGFNSDSAHNAVGVPKDDARSEDVPPPPAHPGLHDGASDVRPASDPVSRTHTQDLGDKGKVNGDELEIDNDLCVPTRNSPNWFPPKSLTTNWAAKYFDEEWSVETLTKFEKKYVAPDEVKHLFTPIPITKAMDHALSSQYTKDTDNFFNRRETERMLFRAAKDISVAYGPFFQALMMLSERGNCGEEKWLITEGLLGVASAMLKITRARRELLRRFFDLAVAKELYNFNPSHSQFFGGSSLDDRVKEAKTLAEAGNNLFFRPKPKAFKSGKAKSNKAAGFQNQSQQQKPQNNRRRQGRGRGRRGKGGKGQSTAAKTSESK